ncbi:MAG: hypothetical protein HYV90_05680 [Candidatus Woesebacteria bacterium]|nr:MAG: hypothetical protein HYV90_05680 [Candidatus Woesebacteria bacterium]
MSSLPTILPKVIKAYQTEIARNSSPATAKRKIVSLRKFLDWAKGKGLIDVNLEETILAQTKNETKIPAKNALNVRLQNIRNLYKRYRNIPGTSYLNIAILVILSSALGLGIYNQFFKNATNPFAATSLVRPNRYLSFQGRLTNQFLNPVTAVTSVVFTLYDAASSGTTLWTGTCNVTPDTDGVFSTLLGSDCGSEISSSVFSDNASVWLGVKVAADAEATPRIQIATVAYALNSETLQGYPASSSATINTVPVVNNSGQIVLAVSSPKIQSTTGTFAIEGQAITIQTPSASNGNVTIAPDGTGQLNLTFTGASPGSGTGMVNATDANLTSGSLYYGSVASNASGYNLLQLQSGSSLTNKFVVDSAGNASASGDLTLAGTSSIQTTTFSPLTIGGNTTGNIVLSPSNDIAGGNISPNVTNVTDLGTSSKLFRNIYGTTIYQGANQVCDAGGSVPGCASGINYWGQALGALYPLNNTTDLLIGATATTSAKFAFKNVLTGTPTASISGTTNIATFIDGNGNISSTNRNNLTLGNSSTYNTTGNILLNPNGTGNVGIGTTAPNVPLEINRDSAAAVQEIVRLSNGGAGFGTGSRISFANAGTLNQAYVESGLYNGGGLDGYLAFGTGSSGSAAEVARFDATGKFGIADTSPVSLFTVGNGDLFQIDSTGRVVNIDGVAHSIDDVSGDLTLTSNSTSVAIADDLAVNGATSADITSSTTTASLFNSTVTTLNIGGAATTLNLQGASAATLSIGNANTTTALNLSSGTGDVAISSTDLITLFPTNNVRIGNATDYASFGSAGDITFVDADGAASITGPAGGAFSVLAGASQALTLTGNAASVWSTTGGLTLRTTSGNVLVDTATAGDVTIGPDVSLGTGDDLFLQDGTLTAAVPLTVADTALNAGLTQGIIDAINDVYDLTSGSTNYWQLNTLTLSPANNTYDLAIGGTATASAKFQAFALEKAGDATSRLAKLNSSLITTGTLFEATASAITSGNMIKLGQGGNSAFSGNGIWMDFDNTGGGGGTFTGNFLKFDNATTTKFIVDASGNLGGAGVGQFGSTTVTTYSRFGSATTGHALSSASDLLVSGKLELNDTLFLDGGTIANSAGTGTITFSTTPTTSSNALSASNWLIENTANVGQAALIVNQQKGGDLFTASASGTPKFTISNTGVLTLANNETIDNTTDGTVNVGATTFKLTGGTTVVSDQATVALFNTTTTSLSLGGAATTLNMLGAGSATFNIGNATGTTALNLTSGTGSQTFTSSVATGTGLAGAFVYKDAVLTTGDMIYATASAITSGNIMKLGEAGPQNFTGNGLYMDFDNTGGGSFTGNFVKLDNAGAEKFKIDSSGNVHIYGNLTCDGNCADTKLETFVNSGTYTLPSDATMIIVEGYGSGGGGGGGSQGTTAQYRGGGGGGGGGAYVTDTFPAASVSATVAITVPAGGAGGGSLTDGTAGSSSSFGSYLTAYGGGGGGNNGATGGGGSGGGGGGRTGVGGSSVDDVNGAGGSPNGGALAADAIYSDGGAAGGDAASGTNGSTGGSAYVGGGGGGAATTTGQNQSGHGGSSLHGGGGGGGGATAQAITCLLKDGGNGGSSNNYANLGVGGAAGGTGAGGAGTNGSALAGYGGGGGGGGANICASGTGGAGGNGGAPGGGGGGGGAAAAASGTTGGTGGTGARGEIRVWTISSNAADLAEIYTSNDISLEAGDVVALDSSLKAGVKKTTNTYEDETLGIVSTRPNLVIGDAIKEGNNVVPVALAGRVPVKVTAENGPIVAGDKLTSSSIPGVAMKATKTGITVGTAMSDFNGVEGEIGRVTAFVNTSYTPGMLLHNLLSENGYDIPEEVWRSNNIDYSWIVLATLVSESKKLTSSQISEIYGDRVAATLEVIAPRIVAKSIYAGEINATESGSLVINAVNTIIDGLITAKNIVVKNIVAGAIEVNDLIAQNITSKIFKVQIITPLPDQTDIAVRLGSEATPSGKFAIQDVTGAEMAAIDSFGNATFSGTVNSQQLAVNSEATISGTLFADNIKSKSLDEIQTLLTKVQSDQNLLKDSQSWNTHTATNSGTLAGISASDLYITNQAAINSLSVSNSIAVGSDLIFGSSVNSINTLSSPLEIQNLAMAPVEIMAGLVRIDTHGNVDIAGNLFVAGEVRSKTGFKVQDSNSNNVASIDAEGIGNFNSVSATQFVIAAGVDATNSSTINGVITTNATAGSATIASGITEITIKNPKVTDYTLIYVTPTSSTNNNVLYVKSKQIGEFVVGFANPIDVDAMFNWWIVQIQ